MVLVVKNSPASAGDVRDTGSIPGLGRSPREGMARLRGQGEIKERGRPLQIDGEPV